MANCKKFQELTPLEKSTFIGKLVHAASNDDHTFSLCERIIELAEIKGVFDGVKIHPKTEESDLTTPYNLN